MSKGLEHFDAVFYLPIYNAFLIVLSILAGAIYFDEVCELLWVYSVDVSNLSSNLLGVLLHSLIHMRLFR